MLSQSASELSPGTPSSENYEYSRLPSQNDIRLIHLESSENYEDPISCSLRVVSLERDQHPRYNLLEEDQSPRYIALSYAWGPTHPDGSHLSHVLLCDKKRLRITSNLDTALRHLRHYYKNEPYGPFAQFWIDAICIDQYCDMERSNQVMLMSDIFASAFQVWVWLGCPHGSKLEADVEFAHQWQHYERHERSELHNANLAVNRASIAELFAQRWFERRWVIQESTRARSCIILIGAHACLPSMLVTLATELEVAIPRVLESTRDFRGDEYEPDRKPCPSREPLALRLLHHYSSFDCSYPRNHIHVLSVLPQDTFQRSTVLSVSLKYSSRSPSYKWTTDVSCRRWLQHPAFLTTVTRPQHL